MLILKVYIIAEQQYVAKFSIYNTQVYYFCFISCLSQLGLHTSRRKEVQRNAEHDYFLSFPKDNVELVPRWPNTPLHSMTAVGWYSLMK